MTNNENSLVKKIDSLAPKGWRLKLAKAAAQLIGGTEKGAIAYGQVRERLDVIEGRSAVSKALAQAVAQQIINDPDTMERAKARFVGTMFQKQENLEAVIIGASEPMLSLPPPKNQSSRASDQNLEDEQIIENIDSLEPPLESDWAATFTSIAENATSEELRSRLSRILAGELATPGIYSRSSIRLISELSRTDLEAVRILLPYVLGDIMIRTTGTQSHPTFEMLMPLLESGLITDANELLARSWPSASENRSANFLGGKTWGIIIHMKVGQILTMPIVMLTRTGNAVVDLLGRPDEQLVLRRYAAEVPTSIYDRIVIGRLIGPSIVEEPTKQLFPEPKVNFVSSVGPPPFAPIIVEPK